MAADGEPWKVDVSLWRLGDAPRELYFDPDTLCRRLTAETRGAILWIKDIWHRRPCYPDVVGGVDIYDAVLNHGVRAPAEFAVLPPRARDASGLKQAAKTRASGRERAADRPRHGPFAWTISNSAPSARSHAAALPLGGDKTGSA